MADNQADHATKRARALGRWLPVFLSCLFFEKCFTRSDPRYVVGILFLNEADESMLAGKTLIGFTQNPHR